jgi:hypothetical protein
VNGYEGLVNITGSNNTIDAGGVAVHWSGVAVGPMGATFRRIDSEWIPEAPFGGDPIRLESLGSSPFTVTGDGMTAGSGGSLSGYPWSGVYLQDAVAHLGWMTLQNPEIGGEGSTHGVFASGNTGGTRLEGMTISGPDGGVVLSDAPGEILISHSVITDVDDGIAFYGSASPLSTGHLIVENSDIRNAGVFGINVSAFNQPVGLTVRNSDILTTEDDSRAIGLYPEGGAHIAVRLQNARVSNQEWAPVVEVFFRGGAAPQADLTIDDGSVLTGGSIGVRTCSSQQSRMNLKLDNAQIQGYQQGGIAFGCWEGDYPPDGASVHGTVLETTVQGAPEAGSGLYQGLYMGPASQSVDYFWNIQSSAFLGGGISGRAFSNPKSLDLTLNGVQSSSPGRYGFLLEGSSGTICLDAANSAFSGNSSSEPFSDVLLDADANLVGFDTDPATTFTARGNTGTVSFAGTFGPAASCALPTLPTLPGGGG